VPDKEEHGIEENEQQEQIIDRRKGKRQAGHRKGSSRFFPQHHRLSGESPHDKVQAYYKLKLNAVADQWLPDPVVAA
jgi:hypothetical protein